MPTAGLRDHDRQQQRQGGERQHAAAARWPSSRPPAAARCRGDGLPGEARSAAGGRRGARSAAMVEAPRSTSTRVVKPKAAMVLAQNSRPRLAERVRTVFQVPCWSSLAKMSPATTAVSSGSTHWPAKPSTSSGHREAVVVANRPKRVSLGGRAWAWSTSTTGDRRQQGQGQDRPGPRLGAQLAHLPAQRRRRGRRCGTTAPAAARRGGGIAVGGDVALIGHLRRLVGEHEEQRLQRRAGRGEGPQPDVRAHQRGDVRRQRAPAGR